MGYESRLYVIEKNTEVPLGRSDSPRPMYWGEVIAVFNLCVLDGYVSAMFRRNFPNTDAYIYADDGDTLITEDLYGDPLTEIPVPDAIRILEEAAARDDYRRYAPCIQMLKGFDPKKWHNLVVLHYGY